MNNGIFMARRIMAAGSGVESVCAGAGEAAKIVWNISDSQSS